jgi:hypothetical protein
MTKDGPRSQLTRAAKTASASSASPGRPVQHPQFSFLSAQTASMYNVTMNDQGPSQGRQPSPIKRIRQACVNCR